MNKDLPKRQDQTEPLVEHEPITGICSCLALVVLACNIWVGEEGHGPMTSPVLRAYIRVLG